MPEDDFKTPDQTNQWALNYQIGGNSLGQPESGLVSPESAPEKKAAVRPGMRGQDVPLTPDSDDEDIAGAQRGVESEENEGIAGDKDAEAEQRLQDLEQAVERLRGDQWLPPTQHRLFLAKITGAGTGGTLHKWQEQTNVSGLIGDYPDGRACTSATDTNAAQEVNGATNVATGTLVYMEEVQDVGVLNYQFIIGGGGGAMVRISTAAAEGGVYNGNILIKPAADAPAGANLDAADMGTVGEVILILNCKEEGLATHDLTDAGNTFDFDAPAVYLRTNGDGVKCYAIDKIFVGCSPATGISGGSL